MANETHPKSNPYLVLVLSIVVLVLSVAVCAIYFNSQPKQEVPLENVTFASGSEGNLFPIQRLTDSVWLLGSTRMGVGDAKRFARQTPELLKQLEQTVAKEGKGIIAITSVGMTDGATTGFVVVVK